MLFVSRVFGPLCCVFCRVCGEKDLDWGWGVWDIVGTCLAFFLFQMRRCGFGVEAVFDFVLSLDLLPHGWFAEWSTL